MLIIVVVINNRYLTISQI